MLHHVKNGATAEDLAKDAGIVTMGINPTKAHLHLGHYLTMMQAANALRANPKAIGVFFVDNREHHNKLANGTNEETFILPRPHTAQRVEGLMTDFLSRIADELGDPGIQRRTQILPMSHYMSGIASSEGGPSSVSGQLYELLWQHRMKINELFEFKDRLSMQYVRPFCADCRTSVWPDREVLADDQGILTDCLNDSCSSEGFTVDPRKGHTNWSMHYTVDPIRDGLLTRHFGDRKVLHVFGGDYGIPWGRSGQPKAERMSELMSDVAPGRIEHFVGPMLVRDGTKIAKSNGDAHAIPEMRTMAELLSKGESIIEVAV